MAGTYGTDPRMGLRRSVTKIVRLSFLNESYNLSHVFFFIIGVYFSESSNVHSFLG